LWYIFGDKFHRWEERREEQKRNISLIVYFQL
jgi:hypothetical protein